MPLYPGHLQNWLDYGHDLLIIFKFWHYLDLVKRVKFVVYRHFGRVLWVFLIMVPLDWNWSYLGFLGIIWRMCGSKCRGGSGGIFPTLCVEFCLDCYKINCIYVPYFTTAASPKIRMLRLCNDRANWARVSVGYWQLCVWEILTSDTNDNNEWRNCNLLHVYFYEVLCIYNHTTPQVRHKKSCQTLEFSAWNPDVIMCAASRYPTHRGRVTYMHQKTIPSLVQIIVCRLIGAKPLSKPMLTC